jgi:hypothetical protein
MLVPMQRTDSDEERGTQHSQCLRLLLDAGCRVDGKYAAGWTALHHATGKRGGPEA